MQWLPLPPSPSLSLASSLSSKFAALRATATTTATTTRLSFSLPKCPTTCGCLTSHTYRPKLPLFSCPLSTCWHFEVQLRRVNNFLAFFKRFSSLAGKIRSDLTQYGGISTDMGKKISTFFHFFRNLLFSSFLADETLCTRSRSLPLSALIVVLSLLISISQGVGFTSSLSIRFNSKPRPLDKLEAWNVKLAGCANDW